jgi:hypothetical protein
MICDPAEDSTADVERWSGTKIHATEDVGSSRWIRDESRAADARDERVLWDEQRDEWRDE